MYTNSVLSDGRIGGTESDLVDQLAVLSSGRMVLLHPVCRLLLNYTSSQAAPLLYILAKLLCHARTQYEGSIASGHPDRLFRLASFGVSTLSIACIGGAARAGGWADADDPCRGWAALICLCSIARSTLGYSCNLLAGMMTHLSLKNLEAADPGCDHILRQLVMSNDFCADSMAISWCFNALNNQTLHHLFPQLPWQALPPLTATLVQVCAKCGVPYHHFDSYLASMRSTMAAIDAIDPAKKPVKPQLWATLCQQLTYEYNNPLGDVFV